MSDSAKHIAVLFHEGDRHTPLSGYIVDHLAGCWREDGHRVTYLFGTDHAEPADLLFVHVNLSVVPESYLDFARRYPIVVNGRIRDIRKSVISRQLVRPGDPWPGPVIVKSDLNFAGTPEEALGRGWLDRNSRAWRGLRRAVGGVAGGGRAFASWRDYLVFDSIEDVPERWLRDPSAVVEKFLPELEDGMYHVRMYQFLGDRASCTRLSASTPLMKAETAASVEPVEPHPEVLALRRELQIDYGKLDYLVHDGEVVLIDVNKTTGASSHLPDAALRASRRYQAEGLYSYFR